MAELYNLGSQLRELLRGLLQVGPTGLIEGGADRSKLFDNLSSEDIVEARARATRRDPSRVLGSSHFAVTLAYGDFIMADGSTIRCEGIPGISGVITSNDAQALDNGTSQVNLQRVVTHFHFDRPPVLIEQNNSKSSVGTLTSLGSGENAKLLPGKASFSQYLILTLDGRPLANKRPLIMTAERVEEWPPIGATFVSESPTEFFELDQLDNPQAKVVATLAKCANPVVQDITVPELKLPIR